MSAQTTETILEAAKTLLQTIGWCQHAYSLDSESNPSQSLASTTGSGLTGLDFVGAIHRAAYEESLMADKDEALAAVGNYIGQTVRGRPADQTIIDWNDVGGRDVSQVTDMIDTVVASL